jgi:predicted nucleic-acid-binding protein
LFANAPARSLWITVLALAEVAWVLLSHYRVPRDQVSLALQRVLALSSVQADAITVESVTRFSLTKLDFADCVLAAHAAQSQSLVVTFDNDFQQFPDIAAFAPKAALSRLHSR